MLFLKKYIHVRITHYTEKKAKHVPSGYSLVTHCLSDKSKTVFNYYRGKDCMEKFCRDLRIEARKIFNCETKKLIPLTDEEKRFHEKQEICYICNKKIDTDENDEDEFISKRKVHDIVIIQKNIEELHIAFAIYAIKY